MLSWLWRRSLGQVRVVMYTRRGCHLCEDAWKVLERARGRWGFTLESADVDDDPALAAEHGLHVPVVTVGGTVRFRGVVNPHLLERLLRAEAARGSGEGGASAP